MKNALLAVTLFTVACASAPTSIPVADGPVARTIERVLDRTEAYMASPPPGATFAEGMPEQVAAAIMVARTMVLMPEVDGTVLAVTMGTIMNLHDGLVAIDSELDALERTIYLEDTTRLRALFRVVDIHATVPAN
jgi:hypothetical protein